MDYGLNFNYMKTAIVELYNNLYIYSFILNFL